ncbi:hypothetical protein LINGRAHAP2_LOCUS23596 [Linum grandiflorum]
MKKNERGKKGMQSSLRRWRFEKGGGFGGVPGAWVLSGDVGGGISFPTWQRCNFMRQWKEIGRTMILGGVTGNWGRVTDGEGIAGEDDGPKRQFPKDKCRPVIKGSPVTELYLLENW